MTDVKAVGHAAILRRCAANDTANLGWGQRDSEGVLQEMLAASGTMAAEEQDEIMEIFAGLKLSNPSQAFAGFKKAGLMPIAASREIRKRGSTAPALAALVGAKTP